MKLREGYLLRKVAGKNIVVSVGSDVEFNGMLTLNDTGVFFWEILKNDTTKEEMLAKILEEYDVSEDEASGDLDDFLTKLKEAKLLED